MNDLPSIADLLGKKDDAPPSEKKEADLDVSSEEKEDQFKKKMGQIELHEKEREALRFANQIGFPHIDLENFPISHEALRQIPKERAEELGTVCFYAAQDEIRLGSVDPSKPEVKEMLYQLQERNHANGELYVVSKKSFDRVIKLYDTLPNVKPVTKDIEIKPEKLEEVQADIHDFGSLQTLLEKASTTDFITFLLGAALKLGASDVHIEAEENQIAVRFRLDGILHDVATVTKDMYKQIISRVKLIASLKINITDKPQDGRFTIKLSSGEVDVRVSMLPTVFGESVVMRLLKQTRKGLSLDDLGLRGDAYEKLRREIERPNGMVITTGPTGSGKTTTLYAILQLLNKPGVKIITLEDPVEYRVEGINQSQIDKTKEYTFGKGLKSILRQDPDIAMVGEIRDLETAEIAIQAALTGHLMLSTIHTNSAAGAIPRFLSMGVKPFLLAPALNCIIGQRLVRKLCDDCKKEASIVAADEQRVRDIVASMPEKQQQEVSSRRFTFFTAAGCKACNQLGYKGRIGIYEVLIMNNIIEQMILSGKVSEYEMEKIAVEQGMLTMVQDGVTKALEGITSLEEVFRVIE
jgi:type IV pilus assembly protein PilB